MSTDSFIQAPSSGSLLARPTSTIDAKEYDRHCQAASLGHALDHPTLAQKLTPEQYIRHLARHFPSLRDSVNSHREWDIDDFINRQRGASTAQQEAARFIAQVWNHAYAKASFWHFDLLAAIAAWDPQHRRAFTTWCAHPYWP